MPPRSSGSSSKPPFHLPDTVTPVNDDIRPRCVCTGITDQIHIGALQFLGLAIPTQGDHALPQILCLPVHKVAQTRVNIPRANAIDPRESTPLIGQRARKVDAPGLGDIVGGLLLREVGNVAGHGGRDDEGAGTAFFEVVADSFGAVEGSRQVGVDDFVPVFDGAIEDARVGCTASIGDEGVDLCI